MSEYRKEWRAISESDPPEPGCCVVVSDGSAMCGSPTAYVNVFTGDRLCAKHHPAKEETV